MKQYFVSGHVRWCATQDGIVLLDLKSGKYLGLGAIEANALKLVVRNWREIEFDINNGGAREAIVDGESLATQLISSSLLSVDSQEHNNLSASPYPYTSISHSEVLSIEKPHLAFLANLAISHLIALRLFRTATLEFIVNRISSRKKLHTPINNHDTESVRHYACIYLHLRPMIFTSRDRCFLDSLTLVEFLSRYGVFPLWVFGTKTQPFGAHCWVQYDSHVLNDTPEVARGFTPILVV